MKSYIWILIIALTLMACEEFGDTEGIEVVTELKTHQEPEPEPEPEPEYYLRVNVESISFTAEGGTQELQIVSNTSWSITCPSWCYASVPNGSGNKTVNITATENDAYEDRSGTIVITDGANNTVSIAVSQERKQQQDTHRDPESGDNLPPS